MERGRVVYLLFIKVEFVCIAAPLCTVLTSIQAFPLPRVKSMPDLLWPFKEISQTVAQSRSTADLWRSGDVRLGLNTGSLVTLQKHSLKVILILSSWGNNANNMA